jgi:Glutaredoxin and related proteins
MTEAEILTTPTCPHCTKLKEWMDQNGYDYNEVDPEEDTERAVELMRKSGERGVPQTFVGDEFVLGFRPDMVQELMEQSATADVKHR